MQVTIDSDNYVSAVAGRSRRIGICTPHLLMLMIFILICRGGVLLASRLPRGDVAAGFG